MEEIVKKLIEENKTISAMESCTGGELATSITDVPDSSKVFFGSAVTYSNEDKIKEGVSEELINKYSVYSPEVARSMAYNISLSRNADYGVGITGKLCKPDPNNPYSDDNIVYFSIYERETHNFYDCIMKVTHSVRKENKLQVVGEVEKLLYEILYEKKKNVSK